MADNNRTIVIGLAVIAVLLAAVVGIVIYQQTQAVPEATATAPATGTDPAAGAATGSAMGGAAGAMGGSSGSATPPSADSIDPKAATAVPKDSNPEAFVKAYYEACESGDWESAFNSLPADKKAGNSPEALQSQVSGYGVKSFTVYPATEQGDTATVKADQVTANYGTFENTWTFVKKDGKWFVASKSVTGMK